MSAAIVDKLGRIAEALELHTERMDRILDLREVELANSIQIQELFRQRAGPLVIRKTCDHTDHQLIFRDGFLQCDYCEKPTEPRVTEHES